MISSPASQDLETRRVFSVSRVVERADQVLRGAAQHPIWVRGEVSGWKRHGNGHCYFCLKDDRAELECVLWRDRANALPALPSDGMEVDVCGRIGIYVRKGRFRLDAERLETTGGDGLWHLARERLLAQLRSEGLLDEGRKRPIPSFPERVGLVTSPQGAALHDMWRTMRRRAWWIQVQVSGCAVEGAEAAPDVVRALRRFGTRPEQCPVDLVIVARGGGSRESLWAFNTEPVARAIAACPVPVISAVGHETDFTVADAVADRRAATPTAGAEYATPDGRELLGRLRAYPLEIRTRLHRAAGMAEQQLGAREGAVRRAVLRRTGVLAERLEGVERSVHARAPRERQRHLEERLAAVRDDLHRALGLRHAGLAEELAGRADEIHRALDLRLERLERGLAQRAAEADAKSPLRALARGYAVVTDQESGAVVRSPADAPPGTPLAIRLAEGVLRAASLGPGHDPHPTPTDDPA